MRGVNFRAIGQEPAWLIEIVTEKHIYLSTDYGQHEKTYQYVKPTIDTNNRQSTYHYNVSDEFIMIIKEQPCRDIMSGIEFETQVNITLNNRTLKGCGKILM